MAQIRKAYSVTVETETISVFPTEKHMKSTLMEVEMGGREEVIFGVCFFFGNFNQNEEFLLSCSYRIKTY